MQLCAPVLFTVVLVGQVSKPGLPPAMVPILGADTTPHVAQVARITEMVLVQDTLDRGESLVLECGGCADPRNAILAAKIADQLRREGLIA